MSSHTYLISDTRERHIHGFINTLFDKTDDVQHKISQINTGDYLICNKIDGETPEILACIERKSLKDFAASFKDGRYENKTKMLNIRDKTGCQLYFFVEGPAFPKSTWKVARIPYGNILSAMTNMMIRDGIHIVQTENEIGTAQRLLDFTRSFKSTDIPFSYPITNKSTSEDELTIGGEEQYIPTVMNGVVEKDNSQIACEMWSKLQGISLGISRKLIEYFSVFELVSGFISMSDIDNIKNAGGSKLSKKNKAGIVSLHKGFKREEIKILSGIPGISKAMATQLIYDISLSELLKNNTDQLSEIQIQQKNRSIRLGKVRAERIIKLMNYKLTDVDADAVDEK